MDLARDGYCPVEPPGHPEPACGWCAALPTPFCIPLWLQNALFLRPSRASSPNKTYSRSLSLQSSASRAKESTYARRRRLCDRGQAAAPPSAAPPPAVPSCSDVSQCNEASATEHAISRAGSQFWPFKRLGCSSLTTRPDCPRGMGD